VGIYDTDRTLPSNRLIFEVRRDEATHRRFQADLEGMMAEYGLSDAERTAWRTRDIAMLARLGVHPYFLPQMSRLFEGGGYNHNESPAAQLFAEKMLKPHLVR
jgi:hypothetical protein